MSDATVPSLPAPIPAPSPPDRSTPQDTLACNALEFVLGSGAPGATPRVDPSADSGKARVLEVVQVFGDAVMELKHFAAGRSVELGATLIRSLGGTRAREDFFVPTALLPTPTHPLFQPSGRGWECVCDPSWTGYVEGLTGRRPLAEAAFPGPDGLRRVPLGEDERLVVDLGGTTFVARAVHPSRQVPVQRGDAIDYPLLGFSGFISFVAMMFAVALSVVPAPAVASQRVQDADLTVLLDRVRPTPPAPSAKPAEPKAAPKGPEGVAGRPDPKKRTQPLTREQRDLEAATEAGLLAALADNAALEAILGEAALPTALADGVGVLIGPKATQVGGGGFASRSGGFGGGGTAEEAGGFGPWGRGPGGGTRFRPGGGTGDGVKPSSVLPDPDGGIIAVGSLDRAQIDAVVKRNMAQIRYCYQRELNKNPGLGGKVTVKFVIAKDGSVSQALTNASTLGSPPVETCINGRFLRFSFPEPKGGGIVIVSYPLLFSPS